MTKRTKPPPHPGALIKAHIEALGYSVTDAAKGIGMTRQQLSKLIKGQDNITPETALRLEEAFGAEDAEFWLDLQATYDIAQILNRPEPIEVKRLEQRAPLDEV